MFQYEVNDNYFVTVAAFSVIGDQCLSNEMESCLLTIFSNEHHQILVLAAGFRPKNLAFVRKIMGLRETEGQQQCSASIPSGLYTLILKQSSFSTSKHGATARIVNTSK